MHRKQFLLCDSCSLDLGWNKIKLKNFNLYINPYLKYEMSRKGDEVIHLLGSMYSYMYPKKSNSDILNELINSNSLDLLFKSTYKYSGEYIIIYETHNNIYIFNDACSLSEIYYDSSFSCFSSQPKLLQKVLEFQPHNEKKAADFYTSIDFQKQKLFVANTTHVKNVFHLLPNTYIDIYNRKITRFFPIDSINEQSIDKVASDAAIMIKGYLEAITNRQKTALAVTGGYDSRLLFLASLEFNVSYFVKRHPKMSYNHYDIITPLKLTSHYEKDFIILSTEGKLAKGADLEYENSIDFPRYLFKPIELFKDHTFINGNISEIARNYYGYKIAPTAENLATLSGYEKCEFVIAKYKEYLESNIKCFRENGYNPLDMFYWEQRMGIWAAKAKTEVNALGMSETTPFNSRALLNLLLSTDKKYRHASHNILYNKIIAQLSNNDKYVAKLPINSKWKGLLKYMMTKFISPDLYFKIRILRSKI